ncbi:uncharacterized protein F5Z01DRAFT_302333 [Emericellopsis atlantica]|uniref:Uncharacterized protein n=1 Tax=Emericellopsis atlantica TaxID=2614577 RepID=A0A9P7ZU91_9HYPO|nr:uncharacterized protein F5Z01DRAFT_302333 [Emericellopsis atlantica]KAG9257810.1 hypothetical protein F5Z01DRAFT_302333 [Emericellopsis atlantica]
MIIIAPQLSPIPFQERLWSLASDPYAHSGADWLQVVDPRSDQARRAAAARRPQVSTLPPPDSRVQPRHGLQGPEPAIMYKYVRTPHVRTVEAAPSPSTYYQRQLAGLRYHWRGPMGDSGLRQSQIPNPKSNPVPCPFRWAARVSLRPVSNNSARAVLMLYCAFPHRVSLSSAEDSRDNIAVNTSLVGPAAAAFTAATQHLPLE